jgi:hypothetical protein
MQYFKEQSQPGMKAFEIAKAAGKEWKAMTPADRKVALCLLDIPIQGSSNRWFSRILRPMNRIWRRRLRRSDDDDQNMIKF